MSKMLTRRVLVAALLVVMAMSGSLTRVAARPLRAEEFYTDEPSSGGSASVAPPPHASQWRGYMLPPLEVKTGAGPSCEGHGSTFSPNNKHCPPT
jgi:hypothetical protein